MPFLELIRRRHRWAALADAFIDGELAGDEARAFEAHAAGCAKCAARVASGRELKAAVSSLPHAAAPRSFRLTPAMVAAPEPARKHAGGTPLYLGLMRAGAAVTAGVFLTVLTVSALGTTSNGDDDASAAGATSLNAAPASGSESAPYATSAPTDKAAPVETPNIAPPNGGGVGGQQAPSPMATPVPPRTGPGATSIAEATPAGAPNNQYYEDVPTQGGERNVVPGTVGDAIGPLASGSDADAADGGPDWVVITGAVAGGVLLLLAGAEARRRVRNG